MAMCSIVGHDNIDLVFQINSLPLQLIAKRQQRISQYKTLDLSITSWIKKKKKKRLPASQQNCYC
jgi:hypothetical protein